jgi:hypothetical protein
MLRSLQAQPGWRFWPNDISLLASQEVRPERLTTSLQVTDSYLLALAASKGGRLATLDRRLAATAVRGGAEALHLIGS